MPTSPIPRARSKALLLVYPNPYAALDADGMPNGIVRFDPVHGRAGTLDFIGASATFRTEVRKDAKGRTLGPRDAPEVQPLRTRVIEYDLRPQRLPHTDYHVSQIRSGDLITIDESTARICQEAFVPPVEAFAKAKARAIADWKTLYLEEPDTSGWPLFVLLDAQGAPLPGQDAPVPEGDKGAEEPHPLPRVVAPPPPAPSTAPPEARIAMVDQIVDAALGHVSVEPPEARAELTALGHFTANKLGDAAVGHVLLTLALLYLPLAHRQTLEKNGVPILDKTGLPRPPLSVLADIVVKAREAPDDIAKLAPQPALVELVELLLEPLPEDAAPSEVRAAVTTAILPPAPAPSDGADASATSPATAPGGSP
jgi:hypothetical protein